MDAVTKSLVLEVCEAVISQLDRNAEKCLKKRDMKHCDSYMRQAEGARMVKDAIYYQF